MDKKLTVFLLSIITVFISRAQDADKAMEYLEMGNWEAAIEEYDLLLEEDSLNPDYLYGIGVAYLNANIDRSLAVEPLKKAAENPDANPNTLYMLGRAYHYAYQFDKAITTYNEFLAKDEGNDANLKNASKQIEYCYNAKELMKFPINVTFENLGKKVNSPYADYFPFVPLDESYVVFNTMRDDGSERLPNGSFTTNVYVSKVKDGKFMDAQPVGESVNTMEGNEEIVGLSKDGSKALYYLEDFSGDGDLYIGKVDDENFHVPVKLDKSINTKYQEIAACLADNGKTIYFASNMPGGYGGIDIYVVRRLPTGDWSEPLNLGPTINTAFDEDFPNISPDGKELYFSSKGHTSMGGYDIFKAVWDPIKRKFTAVENMRFPINTPEDNMNFRISETGRHGYVSALREEGHGDLDIYRVTFNEVEPRYTVITGQLESKGEEEVSNVFISVTDKETGEIYGDYAPNPNTMRYVIILPPGSFEIIIDADGFETYFEEIDVLDKSSYRSFIGKDIELTPAG